MEDKKAAFMTMVQKAGPLPTSALASGEDVMTLEEVRALAGERGVPGPDVEEHDESYDGECYCRLCLSYA